MKMTKNTKKQLKMDDFIVFTFSMMTFIPSTSRGNIVRVIVMAIVLVIMAIRNGLRIQKKILGMCGLMITSVLISVLGVLVIQGSLNVSNVNHELLRIGFNILLILLLFERKYDVKTIRLACVLILCVNLFIQILQYINPAQINTIIRQFYVDSTDGGKHLLLSYESLSNFRAGSIYINPNICGQAIVMLVPVFIDMYNNEKKFKNLLWLVMSALSIVLTGSRTAIIIFTVIIFISLTYDKNVNRKVIKIIALALISIIVLVVVTRNELLANYRSFNLSNGINRSLIPKFNEFFSYFESTNVLNILTGSIGAANYIQVDAEFGYIITYYGVLGVIWYIQLLNKIRRQNIAKPIYRKSYMAIILLSGFTSTTMLCMPLVSLYLSLSITKEREEKRD